MSGGPNLRAGGRILALALLLAAGASAARAADDTFEKRWRYSTGVDSRDHAVDRVMAPEPVRAGASSLRFEVRAGDCQVGGSARDCDTGRERAELREIWEAPFGVDVWYAFSLFIPKDFPELGIPVIVGQFHDEKVPVFSNRYDRGNMSYTVETKSGHRDYYKDVPVAKGAWLDLVYQARWSPNKDGYVRVWQNGKLVVDYHGATSSGINSGGPYLKIGAYRSHLDRYDGKTPRPPQVVYFDEYRRGLSEAEIKAGPAD